VTVGRRPGEKLHEALADAGEDLAATAHPSILALRGTSGRWAERDTALTVLANLVELGDADTLRHTVHRLASGDPRDAAVAGSAGADVAVADAARDDLDLAWAASGDSP
jgi:FlaA1/EpsC-like NDP-sugar epimerase